MLDTVTNLALEIISGVSCLGFNGCEYLQAYAGGLAAADGYGHSTWPLINSRYFVGFSGVNKDGRM
ncbi:MAG: hypothetical protein ABIF19_14940 [Planctomycetota bacterium]